VIRTVATLCFVAASVTALPTARAAGAVPHTFPVAPASVASYGRSHHDYPATDIFAPCGSSVVSPVDGTVQEVSTVDRWNPKVDAGATRGGLSWSIVGNDGVRYYGSHLRALQPGIAAGAVVAAGQRLGAVGNTGNARGIRCHLHFGLSPVRCQAGDWWTRHGAFYPWPFLDAWKAGRSTSPRASADAWRKQHPCSTDTAPR
jgi:murein DD-endopeptidase MepM/ murein hydrolase activator NlpD